MRTMPGMAGAFSLAVLLAGAAAAQSPVTVTVAADASGPVIPADFAGLSFEASNLLPDGSGKRLFRADNRSLIALFRNIGIRSLRIGGGTVDMPAYALPTTADIDSLFAFARAADVRVIYSFRLLNGDKASAASIAGYIWQHYRPLLDSFAIGNEPDWRSYHNKDPKITGYPTYLADWREFAAAIRAAAPGAALSGPDTGSNYPAPGAGSTDYKGLSWTRHFADDEKDSGRIASVLQHDYVGQSAKGVSVPAAIDSLLSPEWDSVRYPALYENVLRPVTADGLRWRMTECNDYTGGVNGVSNAFVSALWALDYMHWWAAHGGAGVNFHNKRWIDTDTVTPDTAGGFRLNPKAYGIKAFALGSQGHALPVTLAAPDSVNLTAYAVRGADVLFVTLINKEHGATAHAAQVTLRTPGILLSRPVEAVFLTAPNGDLTAKTDITLGGASLGDGAPWRGAWTPQTVTADSGACVVSVPAASAAVVRLPLRR